MGIWSFLSGGVTETIGEVAKEWIETDMESAEAKSLFVKTLDPNGKMRRDLSRFASIAYGFYLFCTTILAFMVAFKIGDAEGAKIATKMMSELFFPITTAWGGIVGASFGVNTMNSHRGV